MSLSHHIGKQLQRPNGRMGWVVGHAMRLLNTKPNAAAIAGLSIQPTDHILELGCGPGQAIAQMAQMTTQGKIYGIDASPAMLQQAMRRNKQALLAGRVRLSLGEFLSLPMANDSIDKILAVNVIYFWKNPSAILAECHRVLRFGGIISIYATDASTMQHWKFAGCDTHKLYTADTLHSALLNSGYLDHDIRIKYVLLPAGIKGILAVARKSSAHILSFTH